jgi:type III pantothenate kinase
MIARTRAELGTAATVILTGGLAPLLAGRSPLFDHHDPDLTLIGMRLVHDRIRGSKPRPPLGRVPARSDRSAAIQDNNDGS